MLSQITSQVVQWLGIVLVAAGLGGAASLAGLAEVALLGGCITAIIAAAYLATARDEWNLLAIRSWRTPEPFPYERFSPGVARAVIGGSFGVGVIVGAVLPASPLTLVAGAAGVIVLAVVRLRTTA